MKSFLVASLLIFSVCNNNLIAEDLTIEQKVIAITILAEARGECPSGMAAICAVIKQRSINRGLSYKEVCLQNKQFSSWNNKSINDLNYLLNIKEKNIVRDAIWLAKNIDKINTKKIGYADHYYSNYIKTPYWARNKKSVAKIGRHIFFKLN